MARRKSAERVEIHNVPGSKFVELGPTINLATSSVAERANWNFVVIHRHYDPLLQKWGNLCSKTVTKLVLRSENNKPIRWYHEQLFNFCYNQYDKYGDYIRIIDNSFQSPLNDEMLEVQ
jgi:hypothetical protein